MSKAAGQQRMCEEAIMLMWRLSCDLPISRKTHGEARFISIENVEKNTTLTGRRMLNILVHHGYLSRSTAYHSDIEKGVDHVTAITSFYVTQKTLKRIKSDLSKMTNQTLNQINKHAAIIDFDDYFVQVGQEGNWIHEDEDESNENDNGNEQQ